MLTNVLSLIYVHEFIIQTPDFNLVLKKKTVYLIFIFYWFNNNLFIELIT